METSKKMKYGKVDLPDSSFDDNNANVRISMMMPLQLVKALKQMALTEEYGGQYQVLIRDILKKEVQTKGSRKASKIG